MQALRQDSGKLGEVFKLIRGIDRDNNGYVTITELDDILKITLPQLQPFNLTKLLKKFCSSANKVLLDYKLFKDFILQNLNCENINLEAVLKQPSNNSALLRNETHADNGSLQRIKALKELQEKEKEERRKRREDWKKFIDQKRS